MKFTLFLLILLILIHLPVSISLDIVSFQQQALAEHNLKRALNCAGPLQLDSTINTVAQNYSTTLATQNTGLVHSTGSGYGENLYSITYSTTITFVNGSTPTDYWYAEISSYNFNSPGFSAATGHFTQLVWKSTTKVGFGISLTSNGLTAYVVANYDPPGNVNNEYVANVLPTTCLSTGGD